MTDKQIIDVLAKRAVKIGTVRGYTMPSIVLMAMYGHKIYLGIQFKNSKDAFPLCFFDNYKQVVFKITSCNENFSQWANDIINKISLHGNINYDPDEMPDYIRHEVSMAIIDALKRNIGIKIVDWQHPGGHCLIAPEETYEEISIEADMTLFDDGMLDI